MENKLDEEYYNFNKQLAQKIYDSGFTTYRYGEDVPENVEELYLNNPPSATNGPTWYREK